MSTIEQDAETEAYSYLRRYGWATDTTVDPVELLQDVLAALEYWKCEAQAVEDLAEREAENDKKSAELQEEATRLYKLEVLLSSQDKDKTIISQASLIDAYREQNAKLVKQVAQLTHDLCEARKPKKRGRPKKIPTPPNS